MTQRIPFDRGAVAEYCHRWKIKELSFFGSVLRKDFRQDSDVDVLVSFEASADWGLFDHAMMQDELSQLLGRRVDLLTRRAVERSSNPIRRDAILKSAEVVHVA